MQQFDTLAQASKGPESQEGGALPTQQQWQANHIPRPALSWIQGD